MFPYISLFFFLSSRTQHCTSWLSTAQEHWLWSDHQCCGRSAGPSRLLAYALPQPQFWCWPLVKSLISLLKTCQAAWSLEVTTLIQSPATDTTTCIRFFPAKSLIGMEGAKEPTLSEGNSQRIGTKGHLHCHQAAQPILPKMPETQHSQNSSPAVTSTQGARHCWLLWGWEAFQRSTMAQKLHAGASHVPWSLVCTPSTLVGCTCSCSSLYTQILRGTANILIFGMITKA